MSTITSPVILDKTGKEIAKNLKSIAEVLWAEKSKEIPSKDVNYYDYDGTRVYSYTKAEFLNLMEHPGNPAHEGLTPQGWNWTLADAKEYVQKYGILDIGQTYTTDDGKTRLYIEIGYTENLTVNLKYWQSAANAVTVEWGDGRSDTYATEGNVTLTHEYWYEDKYVITMTVAEGCTMRIGQGNKTGTSLANVGGLNGFFSQGSRQRISGRDALKAIEIGEGVAEIGGGAFSFNGNLQLITIPNTVAKIWDIAFFACFDLKAVVIPNSVTTLGNYMFAHDENAKVICLPPTLTSLNAYSFASDISLERICLPEGITTIPNHLFRNCHNLEEIVIPDTVQGTVGLSAFHGCHSVAEINIPVGVTSIGNYAFNQCHNMRKIVLPEGLTTIGRNAFASCFGSKDFAIPSTVTAIGAFAFLYNDGANTFHVKATTPPVLEPTAFSGAYKDLLIYVPYSEDHSILDAYKSATGWCSAADYIVEEEAGEEG